MKNSLNRRRFMKITAASVAGTALIPYSYAQAETLPGIKAWDVPQGEGFRSPDYQVVLRKDSQTYNSFTFYSTGKGVDKIVDFEEEQKYIKLGFANLYSSEFVAPEKSKDTYANSWTSFDISEGPVEIEVKILRPMNGLSLPLKSCGILPSSLGIKAEISGPDSIKFKLKEAAMFAVVPNYEEALEKIEKDNATEAFEGYRNPLFIFARKAESLIPSKTDIDTLLIKPGENYGVEDLKKAKTIYFEAGIHDYSKFNPDDPLHYIELYSGQNVYLEGGAYLYATFKSNVAGGLENLPWIRGRGVISGDRHVWNGIPQKYKFFLHVNLEGITTTDPHTHFNRGGIIRSVAAVGGWHGNTDGITATGQEDYEGWGVEDSFCIAHDTNMYFGGQCSVKNHTVWQMNNAEPLWIRGSKGGVVDGFNVLAYNRMKPDGEVFNFGVDYRSPRWIENVITIRNVLVEAPFIPRLFSIVSRLETEEIIFKDVLFENIRVKTPFIRDKSRIGLNSNTKGNFGKVTFRNIMINGVRLSKENFTEYFEILGDLHLDEEIIVT